MFGMSAIWAEITECYHFHCIHPGKVSLNLERWWRQNLPAFLLLWWDELRTRITTVSISSEKKEVHVQMCNVGFPIFKSYSIENRLNNRIIPIPMDIPADCTFNYAAGVHWGIICFQYFSVINYLLWQCFHPLHWYSISLQFYSATFSL